jgi:predicted DNA-binding protein with PD1-like motif
MRYVQQPGPAPAERAVVVPCHAVSVDTELPAGESLLDALHDVVAAHGADSACLSLAGGALGPFGYVMPALSPDAAHAAWYSSPFHPPGITAWEAGCVTVGWRDGKKFFHCHGIWREADGKRSGGHVLPEATSIAAPMRATGAVIFGARFEAVDDPETGFRLFEPVATDSLLPASLSLSPRAYGGRGVGEGGLSAQNPVPRSTPASANAAPNALAIRLRPNQDITLALEGLARAAGFPTASIHGGVGSIIGAWFVDAPPVEPFATEMFLISAAISPVAGAPLSVGLVDLSGEVAWGSLIRADNPVLMTLEVVLFQT